MRIQRDDSGLLLAAALSLLAMTGRLLLALIAPVLGVGAARILFSALFEVMFFALPAVYGLRRIGSRRLLRSLSGVHRLWLLLGGALAVGPMSLASDVGETLLTRFGLVQAAATAAPKAGLFVLMLLESALIAPVCEELFFRGFLLRALKGYGRRSALIVSALVFALCHGLNPQFPPRALMGLLLGALALRVSSVFAPMLLHAAYNATLVVIGFSGLEPLFSGLTLAGCLIRLMGCLLFYGALKRIHALPVARGEMDFDSLRELLEKKRWRIGAAVLLVALVLAGVTA